MRETLDPRPLPRPSGAMNYALVFLGAGVGGVLRYATGKAALAWLGPAFPWGTLTVNVVGCLVMGVLARAFPLETGEPYRLLLLTGVLGGFTTFSAFSLDTAMLFEASGAAYALIYVAASVLLSLAAVFVGLALGRGMMG